MIRNKELIVEVLKSKLAGRCNNRLAMYFIEIVEGVAKRGNFRGYSYIDEMSAEALCNLAEQWHMYDPQKAAGPNFTYSLEDYLRLIEEQNEKERNKIKIEPSDRIPTGNPHAYYTSCVFNSFKKILNKEKIHRDILDEHRIAYGLDASYGRQVEEEFSYGKEETR